MGGETEAEEDEEDGAGRRGTVERGIEFVGSSMPMSVESGLKSDSASEMGGWAIADEAVRVDHWCFPLLHCATGLRCPMI